jgi:hypothetical protein
MMLKTMLKESDCVLPAAWAQPSRELARLMVPGRGNKGLLFSKVAEARQGPNADLFLSDGLGWSRERLHIFFAAVLKHADGPPAWSHLVCFCSCSM